VKIGCGKGCAVMDKTDYNQLDFEILRLIQDGATKFHRILGKSRALLPPAAYRSGRGRAIDRRLQVLRKAGVISYDTKSGWSIEI